MPFEKIRRPAHEAPLPDVQDAVGRTAQSQALRQLSYGQGAVQLSPASGGLPAALQGRMESSFGTDFSDVRVHEGGAAEAMGAKALAQGSDLHFAPGAYDPQSTSGQALIGHELAHVVQQRAGRVSEPQGKGLEVNASPSLEAEADRAGDRAARGLPAGITAGAGGGSAAGPVQCYRDDTTTDYTKNPSDTMPTVPMFLTQSTDPEVTDDYKTAYKLTSHVKPGMTVSDGGSIAINGTGGQAKEFYAEQGVLDDAEPKLAGTGSMVKLDTPGHSIDVGGRTLKMVRPGLRSAAVVQDFSKFISMNTSVCIEVALRIMGQDTGYGSHMVLQGEGGGEKQFAQITSDSNESTQVNKLAHHLGHGGEGSTISDVMGPVHGDTKDPSGKAYGKALGEGKLDETAKRLGINQYALPDVGEGWGTYTLNAKDKSDSDTEAFANQEKPESRADFSELLGGKPTERAQTWGYHYAGVVAQDGGDRVTLENYNRSSDILAVQKELGAKLKRDFLEPLRGLAMPSPEDRRNDTKKKVEILLVALKKHQGMQEAEAKRWAAEALSEGSSNAWYFAMYGTKAGQSFHEKQHASGWFANPLTVRVSNKLSTEARRYWPMFNGIPDVDPLVADDPAFASLATVKGQTRGALVKCTRLEDLDAYANRLLDGLIEDMIGRYWQAAVTRAGSEKVDATGIATPRTASQLAVCLTRLKEEVEAKKGRLSKLKKTRRGNLDTIGTDLDTLRLAGNALAQWRINTAPGLVA